MNYYDPRELTKGGKSSGLFHYTCRNDKQIWPVGFCAENCPGHATPDEANEHYRQYLIAGIVFDQKAREWPKEKCETQGCNEEATMLGRTTNEPGQFNIRQFCKEHATIEEMSKFIEVGTCISSC